MGADLRQVSSLVPHQIEEILQTSRRPVNDLGVIGTSSWK